MAKIAIKSEKLTPFGGIFTIMDRFESVISPVVDSTLGLRSKVYGFQYSEIVRSLMCVYFCGGSCVEDVSTHLMTHLSKHPVLRTCSSDTILRGIGELAADNISYSSDSGKSYDFNTADRLNELLVNALIANSSTGLPSNGFDYVDSNYSFLSKEDKETLARGKNEEAHSYDYCWVLDKLGLKLPTTLSSTFIDKTRNGIQVRKGGEMKHIVA